MESDRSFAGKVLLLAGLALACLAASCWLGWRFHQASGGYPIWLVPFGNVSPVDLHVLKDLLLQPDRTQAAVLLFWIYAGPDLIMPAVLAGLGMLLLKRFAPGGTLFRKPLTAANMRALLAVPLVYALADYAENALSIAYFCIPEPPAWIMENAPVALPWIASFKMAFFCITLLLTLRFVLLRWLGVTRPEPRR